MNPDGSSPASRLDGDPAIGNHPKYSPDGSKIAFEGDSGSGYRLWVMDPDGGNQLKLTDLPLKHATLLWSPFSDLIMFQSITQTYTIRKDGTGLALIPNWPVGYGPSSWTANGNRILAHAQSGGFSQVFSLNPDGTNPINLSSFAANEYHAQWTPDGTRIVYESQRTGRDEIWAMNADGSNPVQLTDTPNNLSSIYPRVSPDGTQIVFSSDRSGAWDIYVMDADGSNETAITNSGPSEQWSSWGPYPALTLPQVSFSAAAYSQTEGVGSATISVTLATTFTLYAAVNYSATTGLAQAGSDFIAVSGTLTFTPGAQTATFQVPLTDDSLNEGPETINLSLSYPRHANLGSNATASLTILDNDARQIFMPLSFRNYLQLFTGPNEQEDNDTAAQANGALISGQDYTGKPDDQNDYFSFYAFGPGPISIDLQNITGSGIQLQLYAGMVNAGTLVRSVASAPFHIDYTGFSATKYFVRIYVNASQNESPYTLRVTYPQ